MAEEEIFLYSRAFRPGLGPTQPPMQGVPEALSTPGGGVVEWLRNLHLVPR
jgi:hypothetical protein